MKNSKYSLKLRLTFLFGLFSIITCLFVATGLSISAKSSILKQNENSLIAIVNSKVEALQFLFEKFRQDTDSISVTKFFQDALVAMESIAYGTGIDISADSDLGRSDYYKPIAAKYEEVFKEYIEQYKIKNFFAVLNSGAIIAQGHNLDFVGLNLLTGKLKDSALTKCYQGAKSNKDKTFFEDVSIVEKDQPATALACKVIMSKYNRDGYSKEAIMGVLIVEIDWNQALALVKNVEGLGSSGQIYVLAEDNTSRIAKDVLKVHSSEIISKNSNVIAIGNNESGQSFMSAVKKINLQGLNWKMYAEISMQDILDPIYSLYKLTFFMGFGISLLLAFLGYMVANSISVRLEKDAIMLDQKAHNLLSMSVSLSEASRTLASSSTEQASSLEETVATLEEFNSIVKQNKVSTTDAAKESNKSRQGITTGRDEIALLVTTMREMETSSKKIEEIINVIDDIAFQTNLLALNAAVEAARAGEQGKGFAVVADAVQTLAKRSAEAAKDIAFLINESVANIQKGVLTVENNNKILSEVFGSVTNVAELNGQIALSIQEQAQGIDQISVGMNQLDSSAQTNVATSEQLSNSARSLEEAAQDLKGLVNNLKGTVLGEAV